MTIDIDEESDLTASVGVRSVPTMLAWDGGKVVGQLVGAHNEGVVRKFFAALKDNA